MRMDFIDDWFEQDLCLEWGAYTGMPIVYFGEFQ